MNYLKAALAYEQLGWFVLPIDPLEKKPIVKWKNRRHSQPSQSEIIKWWEKFPKARVGIATGKYSNVTVIDLDGQEAIEHFATMFGGLPETIIQETGRKEGGLQLFFKYNCSEMKNLAKDSIDVRNTGAICLLPPSLHKSGKRYRWKNINPIEYGLDDLLDMPIEFEEWLLERQKKDSNKLAIPRQLSLKAVPRGQRHEKLKQLVGKWIGKGLDNETIIAAGRGWYENLDDKIDFSVDELNYQLKDMIRNWREEKFTTEIIGFNGVELINKKLPEPKWAVPNILPEGFTILAGRPKKGKSIMALNVGIAISGGKKALGHFDVEKGGVIYLALEDTARRLQYRYRQMIIFDNHASKKLYLYTRFPRMGRGGLTQLKEKINEMPDLRLIIIDTITKFKPATPRNKPQFDVDYENGVLIKQVADDHNVSVLGIHHMRKTQSDDPFDDVSGTFGVTASADGVLLLIRKHGKADAELKITGRDVEPADYALEFDPDLLSWKAIGKSVEVQATESQQKIYDVCADAGKYLEPKEIAELTGLKISYVYVTATRMYDRGDLDKKDGKYGIKVQGGI